MQINNYRQAKQRGAVSIAKYGQAFSATKRKYDPDTGAETVPEMSTFTREEVERQRAMHAEALAEYDALLADLDALKNA